MPQDFPLLVPASSQGEWTAKRFYGDPKLAAAYLPVAYALLGMVKQRMALGGVSYGAQMLELPDGTRIRVLRNGEQNIVEIAVSGYGVGKDAERFSLFIENGLLYLLHIEWSSLGSEPTNRCFKYSVGDSLLMYFSGPGTLTSMKERTFFHLHNQVRYTRSKFLKEREMDKELLPRDKRLIDSYFYNLDRFSEAKSPEFKQQIEDLFGVMSAESGAFFTTPKITIASNYTGLMRLAVQTWMGVGRAPGSGLFVTDSGAAFYTVKKSICPFNFVEPFNDGLIHDENYNFWWVRFAGHRVYFAKLRIPSHMTFVKRWLREGGISETDRRKYLMFLLAGAHPDDTVEKVIVEDDRLDNLIGEGRAPLYYGWHFNYEPEWKASIVTHRIGPEATTFDFWREATLGTVAFGFKSDADQIVPYITRVEVASQDVSYMLPAIHALHYPTTKFWCALAPPDPEGNRRMSPGDSVPLYCFYKKTGELEVIYYVFNDETTIEFDPTRGLRLCGLDGEDEYELKYRRKNVFGGYYTSSDSVNFSDTSYSIASNIYKDYGKVIPTITTTNESAWWVVSNGDCVDEPFLLPPGVEHYVPKNASIIKNATAYREIYTAMKSEEYYLQFVVIPVYDAEACFMAHVIRELEYNRYKMTQTPTADNTGNAVEVTYPNVMVRYGPYGDRWTSIALDYVYYSSPSLNSGGFTSTTEHLPEIETYKGVTLLATSRGVFESSAPHEGWRACIGYSVRQPCDQGCVGTANLAFTSGGAYTNHDHPRSVQFLEGYPPLTKDLPAEWRWIGDA